MKLRVMHWSPDKKSKLVDEFLARPAFSDEAETAAAEILAAVRAEGNRGVIHFAQKFDGVRIAASRLRVSRPEMDAAQGQVSAAFRGAVQEACRRVARFARAGLRPDWSMKTPGGGSLGERFQPFDRVGAYIPGGSAPLASTAVMTVTLARVAGVKEIVACSPSRADGSVDPHVLYALKVAGATEVYRVGGVHAIGMMAYGTSSVPRVQKIVGPGGTFVTAAKRQVYGQVALDLVAGPSEIAILADDSAVPRYVAADLLSQAEHGTGWEKALLVTSSAELADAVSREVPVQAASLSRHQSIAQVMRRGMLLVTVSDLADGMELCNRFAPEHFELMVRSPKRWLGKVRAAGAVFLGPWSPEATGDFVAGPSHVLPTGGAAALFSGLTVEDFRRRSSFVGYTKRDLQAALPVIEEFGRVEGLDGHAHSARIRFQQERES